MRNTELCRIDAKIIKQIQITMAVRRVTMRDLAPLVGMPYRTLQNYLQGKSRLPAAVVIKLAEALNVRPEFLLCGNLELPS
ncbi:MAG: helix-turn-helix transcriptional regulator [Geminicoccaceae bacterium]